MIQTQTHAPDDDFRLLKAACHPRLDAEIVQSGAVQTYAERSVEGMCRDRDDPALGGLEIPGMGEDGPDGELCGRASTRENRAKCGKIEQTCVVGSG
jgi:hypothetical protein